MQHSDHKVRAEELIAEGEKAVAYISQLNKGRPGSSAETFASLTARMDEYGKKAMGIWAQAQVHAILSLKDSGVD